MKWATASYCDCFCHCANTVRYGTYSFYCAAARDLFPVHWRVMNGPPPVLCTIIHNCYCREHFWPPWVPLDYLVKEEVLRGKYLYVENELTIIFHVMWSIYLLLPSLLSHTFIYTSPLLEWVRKQPTPPAEIWGDWRETTGTYKSYISTTYPSSHRKRSVTLKMRP